MLDERLHYIILPHPQNMQDSERHYGSLCLLLKNPVPVFIPVSQVPRYSYRWLHTYLCRIYNKLCSSYHM